MKFVCALLFSFACSLGVMAQQQHFVYIQTENGQPFYVQIDNAIYSSSASGYVLLAPLIDSSYKIAIGFPKSESPQQQYSFTIDNNDLGFLLKYTANKWVLSDLQKAANITPDLPQGHDSVATEVRTDAFAMMLSSVVNDPSIKQKITEQTEGNTEVDSPMEKIPDATALWSTVTKISSKKTAEGTEITYVDTYGDQQDTIKIVLPFKKVKVLKPQTIPEEEVSEPAVEEVEQPVVKTTKPDKPKEEQFLNISVTPKNIVDSASKATKEGTVVKNKTVEVDTTILTTSNTATVTVAPPIKKDTVSVAPTSTMVNSECKNLATQEDFIKLRRKMADQTDDNSMLMVAKKTFRTRCFTTEQIKNMGALFFSDQGRYTFFETAYEVVSDGQNYEVLKDQLTDPAYIARFESMIHH
jgi:hypothetical protein